MNFYYEKKTKKTLDQTLEALKKNLSDHSFGVLWELDFKDTLLSKGLEFDKEIKVLEVCNPARAQEVLNEYLDAGYVLPCKMVVYEEDDYVHIGMVSPIKLIDLLEHDALKEIGDDIEKELKAAIDATI